ncbi:MAG TPA: alanine racemase [Candidatus Eremiobacteraceae bacterium]|nr:alanine racemase [Candidatus Eremiobacteraceae bacterium]
MTGSKTRPWLEVSPNTLLANARALAARVAPSALCAVVKSNAYGHGLVPVGKALSEAGIGGLRLGVFTPAEAFELREAGVAAPLIVLGPQEDADIERLSGLAVELALTDDLDASRYRKGAAVHVKIDTGVGRFGGTATGARNTIELCESAGVRIAGVYSHLANAEDLDERFTTSQLERLLAVRAPAGALRHIAASAAAIMWPATRLDMVRCGIALYGYWPSEAVRTVDSARGLTIEHALRWFAPVVQVRDVPEGTTVGYGCEFVAKRPSSIAVLPLGYADGLPRAAGNGALKVRFGNASAPIAGRICMNACMVDVTDVQPQVVRGDVAELDIDDVAQAAGTIAYEVLARLPESLDRVYV